MAFNMSEIEDIIKNHMEQQPYKVKCMECGTELSAGETEVESDFDIHTTVEPCQTCIDSAVEEAKAE